MQHDFDSLVDRRGTSSTKWERTGRLFGSDDVLPMWVADMDLPCPEPVLEALRARLEHPILGYTFPPESLYEAVVDRMERAYGWTVERDWIVFVPGVVNALYAAITALTDPGDQVVIQPPVYYPFFGAVRNTGCHVVSNQLVRSGDRYFMDLEALPGEFATSDRFPGRSHRIRALVLCSPHNPVGRVWSQHELRQLAEICVKHDCAIISDEIHCDLLVGDLKHTVTSTLSSEIQQRTITLMAPSKSFNLAGLQASFAIIPDPVWRRRFAKARTGQPGVNTLGLVAMEAALRHGDPYLEQLNAYLRGNVDLFINGLETLDGVTPIRPEGTYLIWVDMSGLGLDDEQLGRFLVEQAGIATDFGHAFGPGGGGYQRFNLGCPRSLVEQALERLHDAIRQL